METDDLIFLILSYAPGERLFDYVKNYKQTIPDRQVNLENVFTEPIKNIDIQNDNVVPTTDISLDNKIEIDDINENLKSIDVVDNVVNVDLSVNELVINSQRLLLNVDRVLTEVPNISDISEEEIGREVREEKRGKLEKETGIVETQSNTVSFALRNIFVFHSCMFVFKLFGTHCRPVYFPCREKGLCPKVGRYRLSQTINHTLGSNLPNFRIFMGFI